MLKPFNAGLFTNLVKDLRFKDTKIPKKQADEDVVARRPLSMVPENTLKYGVGLLLATFGTFWVVEGIGSLRDGQESVEWPGHDLALLVVLVGWFLLSRAMVAALRVPSSAGSTSGSTSGSTTDSTSGVTA